MAINNFIPELWSASIREQLTHGAVLSNLANRQYQGEFTSGHKIHIPGITPITIKDYKSAGRTTNPEDISDTDVTLEIDQEKSFDFYVDDIDRAQSKYGFDAYTRSAAIGLLEDVEAFLAKQLVAGDSSPMSTTSPTTFKAAWNVVLDLGAELTKKKIRKAGRILLVNAGFERLLLDNDGKLTAVDTSGDNQGLREARIGRLAGFDVISSPYLDNTKPLAVAFLPEALAYVSQLEKTEAMRGQNSFKDRIRGLHVYGGKVVLPDTVRVYQGK